MAKSTRSKVKRQHRAKKRTEGVYAATEAARLHRLHTKLKVLASTDRDGDIEPEDASSSEGQPVGEDGIQKGNVVEKEIGEHPTENGDGMDLDPEDQRPEDQSQKRVSTHGPRNSRREQWRLSKGMGARPQSKGVNRQGGVAAKRRAGRSHRRR